MSKLARVSCGRRVLGYTFSNMSKTIGRGIKNAFEGKAKISKLAKVSCGRRVLVYKKHENEQTAWEVS